MYWLVEHAVVISQIKTIYLSVFSGSILPGSPADDTAEIGSQVEEFITSLVELVVDVPIL